MLPALIIFLLTYLLMLVLPQYRPFAALGGAALFLALGAAGLWDFTLMDAARAVDFNVLLMMAGTMGTVSLFIESRMPARLAELLIVRVPNVKWAVCMLAACQFDPAEPKAQVPEQQQKTRRVQCRGSVKQYLQKFPKWGRFGVTSVTPFLLLPIHPEGYTPAHHT